MRHFAIINEEGKIIALESVAQTYYPRISPRAKTARLRAVELTDDEFRIMNAFQSMDYNELLTRIVALTNRLYPELCQTNIPETANVAEPSETYWSESRDEELSIKNMETSHIRNALLRKLNKSGVFNRMSNRYILDCLEHRDWLNEEDPETLGLWEAFRARILWGKDD